MSNRSGACSTRSARGPRMPRSATPNPVALATTPISAAILVPSANDVIIFGRWPWASANPFWVSGVRLWSRRLLMLPARIGRKPSSRTSSIRSMITAGWSPAMSVRTTPAASARVLRIGPRQESSSALIRTRCLPASIVRSATPAPNSTSPVASTMASMPSASVSSVGSSVTTGRWRRMAASSSAAEAAWAGSSAPASR